jgi:hypothetical protein
VQFILGSKAIASSWPIYVLLGANMFPQTHSAIAEIPDSGLLLGAFLIFSVAGAHVYIDCAYVPIYSSGAARRAHHAKQFLYLPAR